jgi:hypothetical protein
MDINNNKLKKIIDFENYPLHQASFVSKCRDKIDNEGCIVLPGFLNHKTINQLISESKKNQVKAYYCRQEHSVFIMPYDDNFPPDHPRNRLVVSSKGCITDDQISYNSSLKILYKSDLFRDFIAQVVGEKKLYEYKDKLSSVNIHYASEGQELGWHFDNSSFAITLLIQKPIAGGEFQYIRNFRDADNNEMNYEGVDELLNDKIGYDSLSMEPGTLVLFRGRNSIHRVTPVKGGLTRMLAVLAYNSEPNISLSETSRMTFYGRLE